jgi:hypothetical protein
MTPTYKEADGPIRNIEYRKNLRDSLGESPTADGVCDRDFVNVAPTQFGNAPANRVVCGLY